MVERSGAQIGKNAFLQSVSILLALMILAGVLTRIIPAGTFQRQEVDGRQVVLMESYTPTTQPNYPLWRWFTAPVEVLGSEMGLNIIVIVIVVFFAGIAFAVLDKTGILQAFISLLILRFGADKYRLLWMVSFGFMLLGATLGTFEEVVPLIPIMIVLAYSMGWDALVGLGISILATNMGFSAAISNPFTLGVAQNLSGLPAGSGLWFRLVIFVCMYLILMWFLDSYARTIEKDPRTSLLFSLDQKERAKYRDQRSFAAEVTQSQVSAIRFFAVFVGLIILSMLVVPSVASLADYSLPIVGILFLVGGVGAGVISGAGNAKIGSAVSDGLIGLLPAIPLILMAASIRFIIDSGGITDTILYQAAKPIQSLGAFPASLVYYTLALGIEFFIASGTAKAFLIIPILMPLADLVGLTRQTAVMAYIFGDGFANLAYPTNPVLLISLGLTSVAYPLWLKWTAKLWLAVIAATVVFLGIATLIHLGPF